MPYMRQKVQLDCREASHNFLREQGQAASQDEHHKEEMREYRVESIDIISIEYSRPMIIKRWEDKLPWA